MHLKDKLQRDIRIFLEDMQKNMISALISMMHGNWLKEDYLWVDAAYAERRSGVNC